MKKNKDGTCTAHNDYQRKRGVISFYASQTLPGAKTTSEWQEKMNKLLAIDIKYSALVQMQVLGDGAMQVPGTPTKLPESRHTKRDAQAQDKMQVLQ